MTDVSKQDAEAQSEIKNLLNEIFDSALKRDFPKLASFHLYGPRFSKFESRSPGRLDSLAAKKGEEEFFSVVSDAKIELQDVKVEIIESAAFATLTLIGSGNVNDNHIKGKSFVTIVFIKDQKVWKIIHEHFTDVSPDAK